MSMKCYLRFHCEIRFIRPKRDTITECLWKLHWLPVRQRISYKILVLTYKNLHGMGPKYLSDLLQHRCTGRSELRSEKHQDLCVIPCTKAKTFEERSYSVAAPTLWNALPLHVREENTLLSFKSALKTHLFTKYFR